MYILICEACWPVVSLKNWCSVELGGFHPTFTSTSGVSSSFSVFALWVLNLNYIQFYWRGKMAFISGQLFYVVCWKEFFKKLNIYIFFWWWQQVQQLKICLKRVKCQLSHLGIWWNWPVYSRCKTGKIFSQNGRDDLQYLVRQRSPIRYDRDLAISDVSALRRLFLPISTESDYHPWTLAHLSCCFCSVSDGSHPSPPDD